MEKEKYYTPTIEEFHVGFEYEEALGDKFNFVKTVYGNDRDVPLLDSDESLLLSVEAELNVNLIRVKYLDREDIESLFKDYYCFKFVNDTDFEFIISGVLYYGLFTKHDSMISFYEDGWESCVFRGAIKNKSELNKLMKQLGIK